MSSNFSSQLTPIPTLSIQLYEKLQSFVFEENSKQIKIATCKIQNVEILKDFLTPSNKDILAVEILEEEFHYQLQKYKTQQTFEEICLQLAQDENLAIQKMLNFILQESIREQASDIHIESMKDDAQIRIRVDSIMQELFCLKEEYFSLLSSSLKLECSLDIHEKRKPQDGRFSRVFEGIFYDFRFSSLPTSKGESLVIRILCKNVQDFKLTSLGFPSDLNFNLPNGLIFVTGPTGSGKSTTLYAMLEELKGVEKKIITLEDPIEYDLEQLTQVAICEKYGFGFKEALRFILRQDPDVIMVGEIRDQESLALAIQASLTGHLVISTLHTNDALSTLNRLFDMQAKPYLIATILHLIISQRLVRKLCPYCKTLSTHPPLDLIPDHFRQHNFYQAKGCPKCHFKGYNGRILLYEILPISQKCKTLIASKAPKEDFMKLLKEERFLSLFEHGIQEAIKGHTSLEEVIRVAYEI